jgi:DEAD/DEAH box helicase domain-containing protein
MHNPRIQKSIALRETLESREASQAPFPDTLPEGIVRALRSRGIEALYTHQRAALDVIDRGRDVVVATPTASGKSLCYHLPVLSGLIRHPGARALYLFPTKALARDQEASVGALMSASGITAGAITYDGDTPPDARRAARERAGVLVSNPDMLHGGILPQHAAWARLFANLRFVVIDELHMYRGVFGSHLANVLKRLLRVVRFHGGAPQFIFSSATIGNPQAHASRLLGREVDLIDKSGAPAGKKTIVLYNPPVVNAELGIRRSYIKESVRLAGDLMAAGVSTMVFGQSRNQVEVMLKYLRHRLEKEGLSSSSVQGYRGGYLPKRRRAIEQGLRKGEIRGVVATNALEIGIDIGQIEAVVSAGYPGAISSLWQRFGRGGRTHGESLGVLVTSSTPLDQYVADTPGRLMEAPVEEARIDPDNLDILMQHLKCAAFELPFEEGEPFGSLPDSDLVGALEFLSDHRVLRKVPGRNRPVYHWANEAYPASGVSLRSGGFDNVTVIDVERTETIAEMDYFSSFTMLHEQAIYQHDAGQFQVERFDHENHKAFVRKVEPDYYTVAETRQKVSVLHEDATEWLNFGGVSGLSAGLGDVNIEEKVVGYKKIKYHTHENVGYGEVDLPVIEKPTTSFWLTFPEALIRSLDHHRSVVMDGLIGVAHAMHGVAAVGLMMDPRDLGHTLVDERALGVSVVSSVPENHEPTLYLYDTAAGGVGLAPRLFEEREALLQRASALIERCICEPGCPSCVGPALFVANQVGRRTVALQILRALGVSGQ